MTKDTLIRVSNRSNSTVVYTVPELSVRKRFSPGETKEISLNELYQLSYTIGGRELLKDELTIENKEVSNSILNRTEPEYYYTNDDIKKILVSGSNDELLDCIDFGPERVKESIKSLAVKMPLNDIAKRNIIKKKLNFDVSRAIEIENTKYDNEEDNGQAADNEKPAQRRVSSTTGTGRRAATPKYNVVSIEE